MTISLYSKTTMASIAIVVASLGLGCGGGHNSVKNEPVVDTNQDFTVNIVAKNNALLTYTTEAVTNAQYDWTITDDSNKALKFYGQGSNEITITDAKIKIDKIKVSCKVTLGAISHTDGKQFEVDEHAKARLVLQTDASNARASWLTDIVSATTDEAIKTHIDKMKLGNEAASKYLRLITEFDGHFEDKLERKSEITNFLIDEPIIDESYNKMYPNDSLVYPREAIIKYSSSLMQVVKKEMDDYLAMETASIVSQEKNLELLKTKSQEHLSIVASLLSHATKTGNYVPFSEVVHNFYDNREKGYFPGTKHFLDRIDKFISKQQDIISNEKGETKTKIPIVLDVDENIDG